MKLKKEEKGMIHCVIREKMKKSETPTKPS
jgi:hypothetical protein